MKCYNPQNCMENVLVLNANFEPLNVCPMRRAIGLLFEERASLVLNGRGYLRTVGMNYPKPSIIRLQKMIRRPRIRVRFSRNEIFRRDKFRCQYCGAYSPNLTVDHVVPRHAGGAHCWTNVVTACCSCNHHKGSRSLTEAGMKLLRTPQEPPASAAYFFMQLAPVDGEWMPFLEGW